MTTPSSYQVRILEWVINGIGSAVVKAVAGSGKTTTLINCLKSMQGEVIFLAFTKKIALELDYKIKKLKLSNTKASTVHAAGFAQLRGVRGLRLYVNNDKVSDIIDELIHEDTEDQIKFIAPFIRRIVLLAKDSAFGVEGQADIDDLEAWEALATHHDIQLEETEYTREQVFELCVKVLKTSNADRNNIDCNDMVYHVLLFNVPCKKYDWVLIDEAQDTNVSRRLLAAKLLKDGGRLMAVGDDAQAIFGFTGADADSLNLISKDFGATELPLSICYRCAKNIVKEAQSIVPHIEWFDGNSDGSVTTTTYDKFVAGLGDLNLNYEDGIICRNNAPLVPLAFHLIRKGVSCKIEGKDIGARLAKYAFKWKDNGLAAFQEKFESYMDDQISKAEEKKNNAKAANLEDDKDTVLAILARCFELGKNSLLDLKHMILDMFSDSETGKMRTDILTLSSIHKSKGLEWKNVYVLGFNQLIPSPYATLEWMQEQETNLKYVAITRAMENLVYVEEIPKASARRRPSSVTCVDLDAEGEVQRMEGDHL
jgi:superfamily I DNA/RNA helicase